MAKIGFIGSGNMAQAIIKGVISVGLYEPSQVVVSDVSKDRLAYMHDEFGVTTTDDNVKLAEMVDAIVLSIKPQVMDVVLSGLAGVVGEEKIVASIAAGVKVQKITDALGDVAVARVMPNTPALVGEGATAIFANAQAQAKKSVVLEIFGAVGKAVEVEDESVIDSVTALSGSGPAYFFLLMEEMIAAGQKMGLDYETAKKLTLQTAIGSAKLALAADGNGETPAELRKKVTSPGGTTQAAIEKFQSEGFGEIVEKALESARLRSIELSA